MTYNLIQNPLLPSNVAATKAIVAPRRAITGPSLKQIEYQCCRFSDKGKSKLSEKAESLQHALISQKQKIFGKNKEKTNTNTKMNITKRARNKFQQELFERVRDPQLRESWHILKSRKVEDPHRQHLMKFCRDLMNKKSTLKQVPSPDCKTIIILE